MKDPRKTQQSPYPADEANPAQAPAVKAAYSSPVLTVYGTVSKLTLGTGTAVTDGGGFQPRRSDRRAKENIVRVGTHPLGIGLYLFDYLPEQREQNGHGRQFGVMADEVEAVMPGAVSTDADGYKRVNYAMLGLRHPVH